jgi:hypothetical protein
MDKRRSLQVSEACWVRLKQCALDERVTVRDVVERAVCQYFPQASVVGGPPTRSHPAPVVTGRDRQMVARADARSLRATDSGEREPERERHWVAPEEVP